MHKGVRAGLAAFLIIVGCAGCAVAPVPRPPVKKISTVTSEFIFTESPFAQCHASTIVELADGELLAAWYGLKLCLLNRTLVTPGLEINLAWLYASSVVGGILIAVYGFAMMISPLPQGEPQH